MIVEKKTCNKNNGSIFAGCLNIHRAQPYS